MTHPITTKRIAERFTIQSLAEFRRLSSINALSNLTTIRHRGYHYGVDEAEAVGILLAGGEVYADVHQ